MAQQGGQSSRTVARQGVDDLVMLPRVGEPEIVDNIKKRYDHDLIYTYIGPVLISVNPYKDLGNSGEHLVPVYHGRFPHENPPHLYALAEEAYRTMKGEGDNQCVLISGESGAGKTEAAKIIMGYISFVTGKSQRVEYVKSVVLESNPLLEAFGNAKTLRNNNSSRFGKYFEIQFDQQGDPCGGLITNYLLEKSRVVYQQQGERNFHFFYNMLAGASDQEAKKYTLYSADNFYYVNQGQTFTVDGMDDVADYRDVRKSMNVMSISAQEQDYILRLVAAILHIGNVFFREDGKKGNAIVADQKVLGFAAGMLNVEAFTLQNALLFRVINTGGTGTKSRGSTYNVPQNVQQATGARDALAREIYSRMFDWIIAKVNLALQKYKTPFRSVIGILDIYGFEIFNRNGFEQFCINFVNEKLQQFFIELTLKAEQEEYVREGIKWNPIKYFNNQIVCELIEGKIGIFGLLDDICYTIHAEGGKGTDIRFLEKLTGGFGQHPHYRGFNNAFCIKHYAGDVTYDVEGMSDKNKDTLFSDLIEVIQTSSNGFLVSLFPEDVKTPQKKRPTTAGFKIKNSAGLLMKALSACTPHYVRCIAAGTPVALADGTARRIEDFVATLAPSDAAPITVASSTVRDNGTVVTLAEKCTAAYDQGVRECVELTLEDGRTLVCTPDHRIRLASGKWVRADKLEVGGSRVAVLATVTPLDERTTDERDWTLVSEELSFSMASEAERARALAFARLLGATLSDGTVEESQVRLSLATDIDVAKVLRDAELVSAGNAVIEPPQPGDRMQYVRLRGKLMRAVRYFPGIVVGARVAQISKLAACFDTAPIAFVREFCGALFGGDGWAPILDQKLRSQPVLTHVAFMHAVHDKPELVTGMVEHMHHLARLLARCGVDMDGYAVNTLSNRNSGFSADSERLKEVRLELKNSLSFAKHVGFRYCVQKEARLAAAVVMWQFEQHPLHHSSVFGKENPGQALMDTVDIHAQELPTLSLLVVARRDVGARRVYDVSVPAQEAFFANGVAVHNCIKPNDNKRPNDWNAGRVQHQVQYLGLLENVRVRRAGFAYRAPFDRFLNRYKKLSHNTWGIWGEWTGGAIQGCEQICRDLGLDPGQWQMGKTKIFIRHPETLFHLEEQVERKDYDCAVRIQNAWKKWKLAKHALEQRARIADILRGNKERQRNSINRQFVGDYSNYEFNFALQDIIRQHGNQESVVFADQVSKLNRRNRPERRDFIITDQAFYVVARAQQNGQQFYKLTRRGALADISSLTMSTLADNYLVMHIQREYDNLVENDKKSEIASILMEYYEALTGRKLPIQFSDQITYKIKSGDTRQLSFSRNESAQGAPILKKAGRVLKVEIASGLPKDTDSTPQGLYQRAQGGGGGRGGAPRGGGARGGPRGGGAPRGGSAPQGAPQGAQRGGGAPRGGGDRGGPRGGGARGGAAPRGAAGPGRGGPPQGQGRGGPARGRGAPPGGGGAPRPSGPTCTALFDYDAQTNDELSFKEGDTINVVQKDNGGWWEGELNGKRGWIPANYVKEN